MPSPKLGASSPELGVPSPELDVSSSRLGMSSSKLGAPDPELGADVRSPDVATLDWHCGSGPAAPGPALHDGSLAL